MEQRTQEWLDARRGKFTASEVYKLMGAKGLGETGMTYIREKVAESMGAIADNVDSWAMKYGREMEPEAKLFYQQATGLEILECEFIIPPWCDQTGASPDGVVYIREKDFSKGIEIKCPYNPANHVKHLSIKSSDELKSEAKEYYWQIQLGLLVARFDSWDFVSYDPRFPAPLKMICLEILPNPADMDILKARILEAVAIKNEIIKQISI